MKYQHGKSTEDHRTPCEFFEGIDEWLGPFDFDAAASSENAKCTNYRTKENSGLLGDWIGVTRAWVNPPYNNWEAWVDKALEQIGLGIIESATFLIFSRVDTMAFHNKVMPNAQLIGFVNGRLDFTGPHWIEGAHAPDPSMIMHFENVDREKVEWCSIDQQGNWLESF